jgi:outer membrane protein TolC
LRSSRSYDLTYGLTLSFDVFDGLNRRRRLENAAVRQRTAELVVEDVRTQLTADLTSAFTNYRNRLELVALERENLEATSANVAIALERFELGEITSVELREVQEQLIQAESRLLAAQFEAKQAEITLLQLSGQLRDRLPGARP